MTWRIEHGDCLDVMRGMADASVDAIVTDPPYFKVKADWWDRQWDQPAAFLAWIESLAVEWARILKPNGSLYCFASPQMSARVEVTLAQRFTVLNRITWDKSTFAGWHRGASKESLRSFFPASESIVFAEPKGSDSVAKGETGYSAKCDELRGFVFEPLRAYLDGERERANVPRRAIDDAWRMTRGGNGGMSSHWFSRVQWALPTRANYEWLRSVLGPSSLRREYEDLRREYEDLRRPFSVTTDVPYTDVWRFPTVQAYRGKHPCEKPHDLLRHIIRSSTRPGALVFDAFAGSGATGVVAVEEGRHFIGAEIDARWVARARDSIAAAAASRENVVDLAAARKERAVRRPTSDMQLALWGVAR